ncbi:hypothetical protein FZEAL_1874 [Fusarium zealandicum]|uniref:Uncharacterized protein n=1 Tax=Fusarium zealandicum TaxID=1053134 RepID=A0A8H4URU9_9HYPO|nr:hypothetical protein FZEAL_1874 [Fusarium zealandicum]
MNSRRQRGDGPFLELLLNWRRSACLDRLAERKAALDRVPKYRSLAELEAALEGKVASGAVRDSMANVERLDVMDFMSLCYNAEFRKDATNYLGISWRLHHPGLDRTARDFLLDKEDSAGPDDFEYGSWFSSIGFQETRARFREFCAIRHL